MKFLVATTSTREARALGAQARDAANDPLSEGAPTAARFVRTPELDKRVERGDMVNGNAWFEVATGKTRLYFCGFDPNVGRWMPLGSKA